MTRTELIEEGWLPPEQAAELEQVASEVGALRDEVQRLTEELKELRG